MEFMLHGIGVGDTGHISSLSLLLPLAVLSVQEDLQTMLSAWHAVYIHSKLA